MWAYCETAKTNCGVFLFMQVLAVVYLNMVMDIGIVDMNMEAKVEVMQEDAVPMDVEGGVVVETRSLILDIIMVIVDQDSSLLKDVVISIFIYKTFSSF